MELAWCLAQIINVLTAVTIDPVVSFTLTYKKL